MKRPKKCRHNNWRSVMWLSGWKEQRSCFWGIGEGWGSFSSIPVEGNPSAGNSEFWFSPSYPSLIFERFVLVPLTTGGLKIRKMWNWPLFILQLLFQHQNMFLSACLHLPGTFFCLCFSLSLAILDVSCSSCIVIDNPKRHILSFVFQKENTLKLKFCGLFVQIVFFS